MNSLRHYILIWQSFWHPWDDDEVNSKRAPCARPRQPRHRREQDSSRPSQARLLGDSSSTRGGLPLGRGRRGFFSRYLPLSPTSFAERDRILPSRSAPCCSPYAHQPSEVVNVGDCTIPTYDNANGQQLPMSGHVSSSSPALGTAITRNSGNTRIQPLFYRSK